MSFEASQEDVFLATTALEDFWDTENAVVFLGEWCKLRVRKGFWGQFSSKVLTSPYDSICGEDDAYRHISQIYKKLLPALGEKLNGIHRVQYSERYWRILIGPWLQLYLSLTYDHFLHIKAAELQYPNFRTIGVDSDFFDVPVDTIHLVELMKEDLYNLQIYTKILGFLNRSFTTKAPHVLEKKADKLKRKRINPLVNAFMNLFIGSKRSVILQASYFPKGFLVQLILKNLGVIWGRSSRLERCDEFEIDGKIREKIAGFSIGDSEFERCLSHLVSFDIPQCFVEGFESMVSYSRAKNPLRPKAIFSSNSWYFDEHFKNWAAACAESGTMLLGTQHGGSYGVLRHKLATDHELSITSQFYSWGWLSATMHVKPMPATNFAGLKKIGASNLPSDILWGATEQPRYILELPHIPLTFPEYMDRQLRFLNALPAHLVERVLFRPHYHDLGWDVLGRVVDMCPNVRVDSWEKPFWQSLRDCRIYICDHLSTTYAQALAANKPTLIFIYFRHSTALSHSAEPYFHALKAAGILFDNPEEAAEKLVEIYEDVEKWWNNPLRQDIVRTFCDQFARTSQDALTLWDAELKRVSAL